MGQCEYAVHFLEQYKNTNIPIKELAIIEDDDITPDYRLTVQVERWLRLVSPNIKINIEPAGEDFKLKYKFSREENTITEDITALNTGFGITYVLPILIAVLSANKDAIVLIENPEAHLHPKGQAVLMELISKAVACGVQIVMESHSDHIINGSLVAVNKKWINPDLLSIYYFEREEHEHIAFSHQLQISETGRITRPPKGFFDQIDIDLKTLTGFDMEHSELFLLLPKYEEVVGQPDYIKSKNIMTEDEILKVIKNIDEICCFIANENYKGYYDADNVYAFLYPVRIAEDCYPNIMTRMRIVLSKWGENWRIQKAQKDTEDYMYYCLPIKDDTLCEMTERKYVSVDASTFLLVNFNAFTCSTEIIRTKRNQNEIELDVRSFDIKSLSKWYEVNRKPQRIFNLNPKHGEMVKEHIQVIMVIKYQY